jgi:5-methylcytosine-specific restriction endonuclease McrA
MTELPSSRKVAQAVGDRLYSDGKACRRGHVSPRYASNGVCQACSIGHANARRALDPAAANARTQAWRDRNRDALRQYDHDRYRQDIEKSRAESRSYYHRNRPAMRDQSRRWFSVNADRARKLNREWLAANPGKREEFRHRRRARVRNAGGEFTAAQISEMRQRQCGRCAHCRRDRPLTVDHIIPLARGGSNHIHNIQLLCRSCNSRKKDRDPLEFARSEGLLV